MCFFVPSRQYEPYLPAPLFHAEQHSSGKFFQYPQRLYACKMHQLLAMARQFPLEFFHATKRLVVGVAFLLQYHRFIDQILQFLENQQPNHQSVRLARCAHTLWYNER
jgi:hypothetical protein